MRYKVQLILFAALSFFTFSQGVQAQKNVYVGANAGLSMGIADFSSFGADKFRPGWTAGIYGGYRLNSIWSFELTGAWGQQFMAERSCCFDKDYFLGTDGKRYKFIPEGTAGEYYNNLKSRIFVQRYGVQANMNVLGFFKATKDSPWRAEISPALYAAGTNTDILRKSDNSIFAENMSSWHLGLGVNAPMPSLGSLASEALNGINSYAYRLVIPAVTISLIVLSLNLLGDGLRDAFDPKLRKGGV